MTATARGVEAARSALAATLNGSSWELPADVSSEEFLAAVRRHRIETHLRQGDLGIPSDTRASLAQVDRSQRLNALRLVAELFRARAALADAGIRSLAFKGPALGQLAWGEFTRRGFGDLDLLVSPAELGRAVGVLEAAGWKHDGVSVAPSDGFAWRHQLRTYYEMSLYGPRSMIDLHWRPMPTVSTFPGFDELWEERATVTIAGREVDTLDPVQSLRHSALHAAKDNWGYLRSLADVWKLAQHPGVVASATPLGAVVEQAIGIAFTQLGTPRAASPEAAARVASAARIMPRVVASQAGDSVHTEIVQQSPWLPVVRSLRPNMWRSMTWADRWVILQSVALPHHKLNGLEDEPWWRAMPIVVLRRWRRLRVKLRARRAARGR